MNTLLVLIFLIKLFARAKLFSIIREKYGQDILRAVRAYERLLKRHEKLQCDLKFLLKCKKERLCPNFATPNLSIKVNAKVKRKICRIILETEINNKHNIRKTLRKQMVDTYEDIKEKVGFLISQAIKYKMRTLIDTNRKKWCRTHEKKLNKLRDADKDRDSEDDVFARNIIRNFSSYKLSKVEEEALIHGLDTYIPHKFDKRRIEVEFELLYQNILPHTKALTEMNKIELKSKFLNIFRQYSNIKNTYKYEDVIKKLTKNRDICLLKQDKGKGIVVMDRSKYIEKCEEFLSNERFTKVNADPTERFESRVKQLLWSMKNKFDAMTYKKLYPTGSRPGLFYGTAKVHKLSENRSTVNDLPIRPIVSSIGTATYETSRYLATLLAPLATSSYSVSSTKDFISRIKDKTIVDDFELISFDVKSLFTNVPLDFTIKVILDKIYKDKLIKTKLKKEEMKALLEICTKEMHFNFNDIIYRQNNGVCMGNPLGPVIANIFMVHMECSIIPTISDMIPVWIRYVDDTFTFVKKGELEKVRSKLNTFHKDIEFTHEKEEKGSISFLDVMITKKYDGTLTTGVYRKETNSNIYIHWKAYAPRSWKIGTLHGLIQRAFLICSEPNEMKKEIEFVRNIFSKVNKYPLKVIDSTIDKVKENNKNTSLQNKTNINNDIDQPEILRLPHVSLPYGGDKGNDIIRKLKRSLRHSLPENVKPCISVTGTKLSAFFTLKDKIDDKHSSGIVYDYECDNSKVCKGDYIGETASRKEKRIKEHGKDTNSAIKKHQNICKHAKIKEENFKVVARNYPHWRRRKICEAMYIRDRKPNLNRQVDSYHLSLFD